MAPDSYILIWADDEGDEGDYHAGFKIDVDGKRSLCTVLRPMAIRWWNRWKFLL